MSFPRTSCPPLTYLDREGNLKESVASTQLPWRGGLSVPLHGNRVPWRWREDGSHNLSSQFLLHQTSLLQGSSKCSQSPTGSVHLFCVTRLILGRQHRGQHTSALPFQRPKARRQRKPLYYFAFYYCDQDYSPKQLEDGGRGIASDRSQSFTEGGQSRTSRQELKQRLQRNAAYCFHGLLTCFHGLLVCFHG